LTHKFSSASCFLIGVFTQTVDLFLFLSALLWISALFPRLNPFEKVYNLLWARRSGAQRLGPALTLAECQGARAAALAALIFGGFCFGSFIFRLRRGRAAFAVATLPWKTKG
jgi:hypothetical protein